MGLSMSAVTGHAQGIGAARVFQIGARECRDDAWHRLRGLEVDRKDAAMGNRAADKGEVKTPSQLDVGDEEGLTGQKWRILRAKPACPKHRAGRACGRRGPGRRGLGRRHGATAGAAAGTMSAAARTLFTMLW